VRRNSPVQLHSRFEAESGAKIESGGKGTAGTA